MGWWTDRIVPRIVEHSLSMPEVDRRRDQVCGDLSGTVLELGFGSGLNVPHYPAAVRQVRAVEPNDLAWRMSGERRSATGVVVRRRGLDGQLLAEPNNSVDHALVTFTLCTIPDPLLALAEVRRVLRPGGRLHLLEHGLSPDPGVVRWQRRLEPLQSRVAGGCHLTRDPVDLLARDGWTVAELDTGYLPGPAPTRPLGYLYRVVATA